MMHNCNVHCHAHTSQDTELLGIEDPGKWLPFCFLLDVVVAIKQSTDDEEEGTYNCTTVFTDHGDSYIIDTPFYTFQEIWTSYLTPSQEEDEKDIHL